MFKRDRDMAAMEPVDLAIRLAMDLSTVVQSVQQRYEDFSDNKKEFDDVVDDLARITQNLGECKRRLSNRPRDEDYKTVSRYLKAVNKNLLASGRIVDKIASGPLEVRPGPSFVHMAGACLQITRPNRIHGNLNKISANFRKVDGLLNVTATLVGISELDRTHIFVSVNRHRCMSGVPNLSHEELLDFDDEDENASPTPEELLKMLVLDRPSKQVTADTGNASYMPHAKVLCVVGAAGVGKTVALKRLGWDEQVRKAFDGIHYITLGRDATANSVLLELAHVAHVASQGQGSPRVLECEDVGEAVHETRKLLNDRKCLFLVDDVVSTERSTHGFLPLLRQLLSDCESKMVVATKDIRFANEVANEAEQKVQFRNRDDSASRKMFLRYFKRDDSQRYSWEDKSSESLKKILAVCGGHPLMLSIAGCSARVLLNKYQNANRALDEYSTNLKLRSPNISDGRSPFYGSGDESLKLVGLIETSLELLESERKTTGLTNGSSIGEMYKRLGVLKAQSRAPLSMLSKLWNVEQGVAERIVKELCAMSLAKYEDCSNSAILPAAGSAESGLRIHDLQLNYCQRRRQDLKKWHGKLLDGYLEAAEEARGQESKNEDEVQNVGENASVPVDPRPWWLIIVNDNYIYENAAWHFVEAERHDELRSLLLDARWIRLRLKIGGIVAVENDFEELWRTQDNSVGGEDQAAAESGIGEFRTILNALRNSWKYVGRNERELALQLGARLFEFQESSARAKKLVESAIENSVKPFAEARSGFLPQETSGKVNVARLQGSCKSLAYSECGKYIAAGFGKDVVVLDSSTLAVVLCFKGHEKEVTSVSFLPKSAEVLSGSKDGTVRIWNIHKPDDNELTLTKREDWVTSVCASPGGAYVASGFKDGNVLVWDRHEQGNVGEVVRKPVKWMGRFSMFAGGDADSAVYWCTGRPVHTKLVSSVCFNPKRTLLASASYDGTVQLWDWYSNPKEAITPIEVHGGFVFCVAFSPDGELVACGASDETIRLWNVDNGTLLRTFSGHNAIVCSVAFSADGERIVSASYDRTVRLWYSKTGKEFGAMLKDHADHANCVAFCPDGVHVASGFVDQTLRIWDTNNAGDVSASREEHMVSVTCEAFSEDRKLIAAGLYDGKILLLDTRSGRVVRRPLNGHTSFVQCVAFSPGGTLLASGSYDKTVRLWNVNECTAVVKLTGHGSWVSNVSFSADGKILLSRSLDNDCHCLWEVPSGKCLWISPQVGEDVTNVLNETEAKSVIGSIESDSRVDISNAPISFDNFLFTVNENQTIVPLAYLRDLPAHSSVVEWKYTAGRGEIFGVLRDGTPLLLKLHI